MIMRRTPSSSSSSRKKGPWTAEEDEILRKYVRQEGEGGWRTLPQRAGLQRCGKSCRLRWMNYLRPELKRSKISLDEEDLILRLHRLLGNRWALIAGRIPGRTDNEIKNYWNTHLSKKLISQGIDPRNHKPLLNLPHPNQTLIINNNPIPPQDHHNTQPHHHDHHTLINATTTTTTNDGHQQLMTNQVVVMGPRISGDDIMGGVVHEQDSFSCFLDSLINTCDNIDTTTSLQQFNHLLPDMSLSPLLDSSFDTNNNLAFWEQQPQIITTTHHHHHPSAPNSGN